MRILKNISKGVKFFARVVLSLHAHDVVLIGIRDSLPCEVVFFEKYKIPVFSMKEVDRLGIQEVGFCVRLI